MMQNEMYSEKQPLDQMQSVSEQDASSNDFDFWEPYIFACPLCFEQGDEHDEMHPNFMAYGVEWRFVLQNPEDAWCFRDITYDMTRDWGVLQEHLLQASKENISRRLDRTAYNMLFGEASRNVVIPFLRVYLKYDPLDPSFGASLILVDHVMDEAHRLIGDFYAFPADLESFYVLPAEPLAKYKLNPMKSFENIWRENPENKPMLFQEEFLFPDLQENEGYEMPSLTC